MLCRVDGCRRGGLGGWRVPASGVLLRKRLLPRRPDPYRDRSKQQGGQRRECTEKDTLEAALAPLGRGADNGGVDLLTVFAGGCLHRGGVRDELGGESVG